MSSAGSGDADPSAASGSSGSDGTIPGSDTSPEGTGGAESSGGFDPSDGADETGAGQGEPWQPAVGTTWQWQLTGEIDTSLDVQVYDIDLFDAPQATIDALHADGRIVICYFSAGSYEEWRDDADAFPPAAIGEPLDGWPGEAWVDHRDEGVRAVMQARLDLAVDKACDAVEPDNVDGYTNATGFDLAGEDQLDYNRWLAEQAHGRGLSVGLKNDVDQVDDLVDAFDWALNEECVAYEECETTSPFIDAGKAVFHVEYVDETADGEALAGDICPQTAPLGFSSLVKEWDLGPWRLACP